MSIIISMLAEDLFDARVMILTVETLCLVIVIGHKKSRDKRSLVPAFEFTVTSSIEV